MPTSLENARHEIPENLLEQDAVLRWLADTDPDEPLTSERIARLRLENQLWCAVRAQVVRKEQRIVLLETAGCLLVGYPLGLSVTSWFDQLRIAVALLLVALFLKARIGLAFGAACDVVTDAILAGLNRAKLAPGSNGARIKAICTTLDAICTPELDQRARSAGWRKGLQVWDWSHSRRRRDSYRGGIHRTSTTPRAGAPAGSLPGVGPA